MVGSTAIAVKKKLASRATRNLMCILMPRRSSQQSADSRMRHSDPTPRIPHYQTGPVSHVNRLPGQPTIAFIGRERLECGRTDSFRLSPIWQKVDDAAEATAPREKYRHLQL
jgi:hypothetical protein